MIKALWGAVAVLAVVHLLAVAALVGWVVGTGRLDDRRWGELLALLGETTAARDAREAAEARAAEEQAAQGETLPEVPLTAEQQIDRKLNLREADRQVIQRMRQEVESLRRTLQTERAQLDAERAEFMALRDGFEAERERIRSAEGGEQFQQVLATLKTMKPELAHSLLSTTIRQNSDGLETATAYLANLPARNRAGILQAFEGEDPALAADLLERLRTRGDVAAASDSP
jgi:hypothetical protein